MPSGCHDLQDVVRFLVGEVVAALCAIHDIGDRARQFASQGDLCSACEGFMYGDLKPENIVAQRLWDINMLVSKLLTR